MKNISKRKLKKHQARVARVRAKLVGTPERPRAAVFRSLRHIYVQLIDDQGGKTVAAVADRELKNRAKQTKREVAQAVGLRMAEKALAKKISRVIFDRRSYRYHGRVQALAEGMRQGGLKF